jgi:mono/diheme cytochrome c family protein
MSPRVRWIAVPSVVLLALTGVLLLFTYEVIAIDFRVLMEDQQVVGYQDGPRLSAPAEAIPISYPSYGIEMAENPVLADSISIRRGEILFSMHCALCHGERGEGNGPVAVFWREDARRPPSLVDPRIDNLSDGAIYQFISRGIGSMPALRYNLDERSRWDVINFVRSLE